MQKLILAVMFSFLFLGCRGTEDSLAPDLPKDFFITSIGKHEIAPRTAAFEVFSTEIGKLNYRFSNMRSSFGPVDGHVESDDPWFAYVQTTRRIWLFDGREYLALLAYDEHGTGTYSITPPCSPQQTARLVPQIPEPVSERLPEAIRTKIRSSTSTPAPQL